MILGKKAAKICVAYDGMEKFFPASKLVMTGNPVRSSISQSVIPKPEALQQFGLRTDRQTVFAVGGSLGAKSINEGLTPLLSSFAEKNIQLIWQTGKPYYETALAAAAPYGEHIKVYEFINTMDAAYKAADVVLSRAGALAIAELCVVKKPVIFVPYPYAAEDHQTSNAMNLVNKQAGLIIRDSEVGAQLGNTLFSLLQNKALMEQLENNIAKLGNPNADETIAREVLTLIK
jgi:UDP-N-acetylglucosamine--N-acetylmuramyl-(pentapeptide) pyrophosphoryl-undecaprenol N-acetylglucosamine transferase